MNIEKDLKTEFCERLRQTKRNGVEEIISYIDRQGFFEAPASSRFHLSKKGGLLEHSLNVCDAAMDIREVIVRRTPSLAERLHEDSVVIAALLHDVCKADIYKLKIDLQSCSSKYNVDYGDFPLGHGEKSVMVLMKNGLELTNDEIMAIRWHMNAWDLSFQANSCLGNYNKAKQICPLLTVIQCADEVATSLLERQ